MVYDTLIIGAGPIGLACGIEAKKRDLSHIIIEKGCLVNSIYNYPTNMTFFSTSDRIEIGEVPFVTTHPKPNRSEALEYYRRAKVAWDLNVHTYEKVESVIPDSDFFLVHTSKAVYKSRTIVLAIGFYDHPNLLRVPGEDLPKVKHYFDDPHPYIDQEIIIVGARNSAVDAALETWRKGAKVTMIVREEEIHPRVKYWVRPDIVNRIKEGAIKAFFQSEILEIRNRDVDIKTPEGLKTIKNDFVLAMTGFQPDYAFLESMGLEFSSDEWRHPLFNEDTQESSASGIYLAGTVCGGLQTNKWFIENAREHAEKIMEDVNAKRLVRQ